MKKIINRIIYGAIFFTLATTFISMGKSTYVWQAIAITMCIATLINNNVVNPILYLHRSGMFGNIVKRIISIISLIVLSIFIFMFVHASITGIINAILLQLK